jgi:Kdo2-lipid IVA lauroyltransferase/acyltransferase
MSRRGKSKALQWIEYGAYRALAAATHGMSDESLQRWGARLGNAAGRVLSGRSRLAHSNLALAFPEKSDEERRAILRACWQHFGREALNYVRLQSVPLEEVAERCPFVNANILEEAIARGHGVILISAHFGGWEVAGLAIMALVKNVLTVARALDNEYLERDLSRLRAQTGAKVVDRRRAARSLLKGLSENAVVVMLPDQAVLPREGILVPFLGRPAWTTPAPAKMALRIGSALVFAFCIPDGTRYLLEFEAPIRVDETTDVVELSKRINEVISRRITARPELWLWMHDRWKGTGESEGVNGQP